MRIIILCVILGLPFMAQAQLQLGIHAGVNISTSKYTGVFSSLNIDQRSDYFLGITTGVKLGYKLSLLGDVQYSRKGHRENFPDVTAFARYHYLDIIPQLEYPVVGPLSISTGLNFGFRLSSDWRTRSGDISDTDELTKGTDVGWVLTAKVRLKNIFGFVRYNRGISNITTLDFSDTTVDGIEIGEVKQFNRNWQIGVGYFIR